jgi:hypothetical protein
MITLENAKRALEAAEKKSSRAWCNYLYSYC